MNISLTKIESEIRNAFRCVAPVDLLSESEAESLNYDISRCDKPAVQKYLPLLLIKEMYSISNGLCSWSGDGLIYFLDGCLLGRKPDGCDAKETDAHEKLCSFQSLNFMDFDAAQAKAILLWLEEVARPAYIDRSCLSDVDSAIAFWRGKIN